MTNYINYSAKKLKEMLLKDRENDELYHAYLDRVRANDKDGNREFGVANPPIIQITKIEDDFKAICREYAHRASLNSRNAIECFHDNDFERGRTLMQKANRFGNKAMMLCHIMPDIPRCSWLLSDIKPNLNTEEIVLFEGIVLKDTDFVGLGFIATLEEDLLIEVCFEKTKLGYCLDVYSNQIERRIAVTEDILLFGIQLELGIIQLIERYVNSPTEDIPQEKRIESQIEKLFNTEVFLC